uniref:E1A binding protein p400 n=1 Tax=Cyprinus carpio TaxID=7962 RepID=A0A8C1NRX2_CYPCA
YLYGRNIQQPMPVTQQQPANANHPQSPVTSFAPSASPSAPQSPNYQIIMSRSPVTGQNMNITLQNMGPMVSGNQQITLTSLPLQSPASPVLQHQPQPQQWRFESGSSSYVVTSPLSQTIQPQSPTQHSPVPIQAVPRPSAPGSALGVCSQSPTRFVEAGIMVRQISLGSPPGSSHFVYQDGTGLAQLAPTTAGAVQLTSPGTPGAVRERRLSQPHSQTGGTIHHLGPQSPVAAGAVLPTLGSPGHITTSSLPPQISSIIQGQLARPMIFEKTAQGIVAGVAASASASFGVPSAIPPSSPSRSNPPQGLANQSLTPTSIKKMQPKKLEEIAPSNPEVAQLRKQCLEHHAKKMESLKEVFKEYLIELFFLQHLQGNMMDYLAFKKKPCVPLFTYLRQNDLDLEDEEEEEEHNIMCFQFFIFFFFGTLPCPPYPSIFLSSLFSLCSVSFILPPITGGMPPTPQTVQIGGQKQNQQQYDPSKGPPVQNAASLHTPPPQLPGRIPQGGLPMAGLPLSLSQGQAMVVDQQAPVAGGQLQVKVQGAGAVLAPVNPHAQLQAQLQQMQSGLHLQMQQQQQMQQSVMQPGQAVSMQKDIKDIYHVHQRIAELRKEGQWSASRLPKLQEACRPKSQWDYLLEEMQWMAADFAQERRWKMAAAKKLVRTCARYHVEQKKTEEREKREEEMRLRHIASTIARGVDYFWSNIEQVHLHTIYTITVYALLCSDMHSPLNSPHDAVLIDSLLSMDQYRGAERMAFGPDGKPTKDIAEVAAATDLILPKGSSRSSPPALLHGSLREYQQVGVEWLSSLHRKNLNGILADETGLGKTVQTVAYFAHLACNQGIWGPHLVVVRTCKLLNWEMEFKRWCPGLKILLYLGSRRQRRYKRSRWCEPNSFHVCVTSYKLLLKDQSHFLRRRWRHLVLDEVQLIKNMTEKHWETIFNIKSQQRILLINTPLQNTLKELWTMIHFLLPGITHPYLNFPIKPGTDQNQDYCHKLVIRLHRMIQPFILRRSKRDVEKQMPKKYEHILKCRLSKRQKSMYEDILIQPSAQEALKTGHFVRVLEVLMQLQKICNHPDLIQPRDTHNSYICQPLQYNTPSLLLTALQRDQWKTVDISLFDLISNEGRLTRYEAEEALPKLRMTKQLIEEIYSAHDPPARPRPCKIKPMRLFLPVQYGTKPEGHLVPMTSSTTQAPRATAVTTAPTTTTNPATAAPSTQPRGKSPLTTTTSAQGKIFLHKHVPTLRPRTVSQSATFCEVLFSTEGGDVVKVAQLVGQGRIAQPETPVTLQFQGNKFTLSPSQLRQLTTGQPLQLQGNILQIVSATGQPLLRPQGPPMVMPTVPQAMPVQNSSGTLPPATSIPPQGKDLLCPEESSEERNRKLKERLASLFHANERRSSRSVMYGSDLIKTCSVYEGHPPPTFPAPQHSRWSWVGRDSCIRAQQTCVSTVAPLRSVILSNTKQEAAAGTLLKRFSCILPAAVAPPPQLYASNPPPSYSLAQKSFRRRLQEVSAPQNAEIRNLACPPVVRFPDVHMLEMDSGKLEALSILLQKLSAENRRVMIFTQMNSMLDILEAFLDHHHLTYVRLDESLSLEERQEQVKRFNRNRQIFCTILTNHCCSAMGHVFDADTIVFYDTDLNPSMDMRTQEWCDKIGRSKDIHIYRLESGNSIEEKLLKNGTKDLIREVAAQGMDYTLAFLTQRTIQDLFEVEAGSGEKVEEFVVLHQEPSPSESIPPHVARPYIQALNTIRLETQYEEEEETEVDTKSEKVGRQEEMNVEEGVREEASQLEELAAVMEQLTPIERYALHYLEYLHISEDEQVIKERLEAAKRGWEQQQQQKLKVEKEEQMILEDEEDLFTYTREDAYNMVQIYSNDGQTEIMPLWTPPTPPQDDNDIYIDSVICLMYDTAPMPESKLPPVYVRKERKRHMDPSALGRKKKKGHGESVIPPRSLFDKASLLKVRREGKDQKKNFSLKQQAPFAKPLPSLLKPAMEAGQDNPEWLISEDWALLQAVKQLLELPLNLTIVSPAHTPNWDLVSDVVNSCSRIYRSPKQCRNRYENVIILREEGKSIYKVLNKSKSVHIFSRPLRTCQIYTQDDNATQIQLYNSRFELMKIIASKRSPPIKPLLGMNPFQKNPKHASVLAESGISYDKPLPPIQVASQRAERIAKEKKVRFTECCTILSGLLVLNVCLLKQTAGTATAQVVHTQQRAVPATAAPAEVVAIATGQSVRAVTPVTASAVVSTNLTPGQSQTRTLVAPGRPNSKPLTPAQFQQLQLRQQLQQQQQQTQATSPQIKAVGKPQQKLQMAQQQVAAAVAAAQGQQAASSQQPQQVHATPAAASNAQIAAVAAPRAGAVLTGATVTNLQVARLVTPGPIQAQPGQTAQVTLTKPPPVVSVPAVVSSAGVTTLPVTVAGISVAIGQAQKFSHFDKNNNRFFHTTSMSSAVCKMQQRGCNEHRLHPLQSSSQ